MRFHFVQCGKCGKYIDTKVKRDNVLPTMMQFVQQDGKIITICRDCIIELGKIVRNEDTDAKEKYFSDLDKTYGLDEGDSIGGLVEDDF